jgi:hypothetical protein
LGIRDFEPNAPCVARIFWPNAPSVRRSARSTTRRVTRSVIATCATLPGLFAIVSPVAAGGNLHQFDRKSGESQPKCQSRVTARPLAPRSLPKAPAALPKAHGERDSKTAERVMAMQLRQPIVDRMVTSPRNLSFIQTRLNREIFARLLLDTRCPFGKACVAKRKPLKL